ncbi:MAG: PUA domain-containing protein [Candidatus Helarchaeota archaeon]
MSQIPSSLDRLRIKQIVSYQYVLTQEEADQFIPDDIQVEYSKKTKKIRYIYLKHRLWGIIRPNDGFFLLTPASAEFLIQLLPFPRLRVVVQSDVSEFLRKGGNVFAKHVVEADPLIIPYSEVIMVDEDDIPVAIGKAYLTREEMLSFQRGVAVKVRKRIEINKI